MNKLVCSAQSRQELINHYEELRSLVLNKSRIPISGNLGYSILLFRGMAAWIKTCLSSELIYSGRSVLSRLENTENNTEKQIIMLSPLIQEEATMILTNIILSHHLQQESGNSYA
jgi:hypothetical protein